jgi:hypothetical protein
MIWGVVTPESSAGAPAADLGSREGRETWPVDLDRQDLADFARLAGTAPVGPSPRTRRRRGTNPGPWRRTNPSSGAERTQAAAESIDRPARRTNPSPARTPNASIPSADRPRDEPAIPPAPTPPAQNEPRQPEGSKLPPDETNPGRATKRTGPRSPPSGASRRRPTGRADAPARVGREALAARASRRGTAATRGRARPPGRPETRKKTHRPGPCVDPDPVTYSTNPSTGPRRTRAMPNLRRGATP